MTGYDQSVLKAGENDSGKNICYPSLLSHLFLSIKKIEEEGIGRFLETFLLPSLPLARFGRSLKIWWRF